MKAFFWDFLPATEQAGTSRHDSQCLLRRSAGLRSEAPASLKILLAFGTV